MRPIATARDLPQVACVAADRTRRQVRWEELPALPWPGMLPVRAVLRRGRGRAKSGEYWSATAERYWTYESGMEREHFMAHDRDPDSVSLLPQPLQLLWADRSHIPDALVVRSDGQRVLLDIHDPDDVDDATAAAYTATSRFCRAIGWSYRVLGPLPRPYLDNLEFLSAYRHPRCRDEHLAAELAAAFREPVPLQIGVELVGDPIRVLPAAYHELWAGRLDADLHAAPLRPSTPVTSVRP